MKTEQYLDAAKKKLGLASDYALAKALGVTKQALSNYRNRPAGAMSITIAAKVAEILELDPLKVIADAELERGNADEIWKRLARKVAAIAAVSAVGATLAPSSADAAGGDPSNVPGPVYYVKSLLAMILAIACPWLARRYSVT